MIAPPLPSAANAPPRNEASAEPQKAPSEGRFAGLLGAYGERPGPERNSGAADQVPVGRAPFAGMSNVSGPQLLGGRDCAAERFNEDGFFGTASSAPVKAGSAVQPIAVRFTEPMTVAAETLFNATGAESVSGSRVPPALQLGSIDGAPTSTGRARAIFSAAPRPVANVQDPVAGANDAVAREVATAEPQAISPPGRRLIAATAARGAQSAVRVAISEIGHGLQVAAFTGALSAEEQGRLRDEIAALLSRHGLVSGRIQISARRVPPATQE